MPLGGFLSWKCKGANCNGAQKQDKTRQNYQSVSMLYEHGDTPGHKFSTKKNTDTYQLLDLHLTCN